MSKLTVYESILEVIAAAGVKQIFGIVGDAINPLVDAIRRDDRIEWIHVRHEEVGAFAASAQAKLTGNLAVCAGTVGPGAIHLLNGLYDAKKDRAPVLALTGQVVRSDMGTNYHQEVDLQALFADVCVFNQTITVAEQTPALAFQAIQSALSKRGVAHLSIPSDLGGESIPRRTISSFSQSSSLIPSEEELQAAAELINDASTIGILAGVGLSEAADELSQLAEKLCAPITYALRGKTILSHAHPHWMGATGLIGSPAGMHTVNDCELLLMLGTNFPYKDWLPKGKKILQLDIRPEHLGSRTPITLGLTGDAKTTLQLLLPRLEKKTDRKFLQAMQERKASDEKTFAAKADLNRDEALIHPQAIAATISELAADDAVFCVDTGEVTIWATHHLQTTPRQKFLASFNLASMAFALPAAIGIQLLDRTRQVIALSGDGGFSMLMGDLITAVTYKLPVKIVIFNNSKLGLVKMEMEASGYPEYGTELKNPNFAEIARVCGARSVRVEKPGDLKSALATALASNDPFVVDVVCSGEELSLPPRIEPNQALGFGLAKVKEFFAGEAE